MIRYPSVAGMFYPEGKEKLNDEVVGFLGPEEDGITVKGLISPHAGYMYSGSCAGKGFAKIKIPGKVIIIGVNHGNEGFPMAVDNHEKWVTPLGEIEVDTELSDRLIESSEVFIKDSLPSMREHSVEVQIPFIQIKNPNTKILPISIGFTRREDLKKGGVELGRLIADSEDEILMVASTDMSHYISSSEAEKLDSKAIEKISDLDPDGLFDVVKTENISMCGVAPTFVMMSAAKFLGATFGKVIEYTNSGYASGDFEQVVGYLSAIVN